MRKSYVNRVKNKIAFIICMVALTMLSGCERNISEAISLEYGRVGSCLPYEDIEIEAVSYSPFYTTKYSGITIAACRASGFTYYILMDENGEYDLFSYDEEGRKTLWLEHFSLNGNDMITMMTASKDSILIASSKLLMEFSLRRRKLSTLINAVNENLAISRDIIVYETCDQRLMQYDPYEKKSYELEGIFSPLFYVDDGYLYYCDYDYGCCLARYSFLDQEIERIEDRVIFELTGGESDFFE